VKPRGVKNGRRAADPERRQRRHAALLEAAARLFARYGYADTDLQVLADTLHAGKGTLYLSFPSKRELFLAAAITRFAACGSGSMNTWRASRTPWSGPPAPSGYLAFFPQ
jgi:AcrR family transcriptional regulator